MYCQNRMVHTVQEGDSLYRLCETVPHNRHGTDTQEIRVNPYNLQVKNEVLCLPGSYVPPQGGSANTGNTGTAEAPREHR